MISRRKKLATTHASRIGRLEEKVTRLTLALDNLQNLGHTDAPKEEVETTPQLIDINKTYKTRNGHKVKLFSLGITTIGNTVTGYIDNFRCVWDEYGYHRCNSHLDLVECKPRIKLTRWANIYKDNHLCIYNSKEIADVWINDGILARIPIEIDCEEGLPLGMLLGLPLGLTIGMPLGLPLGMLLGLLGMPLGMLLGLLKQEF
jgi:hypothetical protein